MKSRLCDVVREKFPNTYVYEGSRPEDKLVGRAAPNEYAAGLGCSQTLMWTFRLILLHLHRDNPMVAHLAAAPAVNVQYSEEILRDVYKSGVSPFARCSAYLAPALPRSWFKLCHVEIPMRACGRAPFEFYRKRMRRQSRRHISC